MKVLIISTTKPKLKISPIVKNQGDSLKKEGLEVSYYTIIGGSISAYIKNIKPLKQFLKTNKFDIIHVHYSFTAFVASLAGAKPLVVSLMGTDIKYKFYYKYLAKFFNLFFWKKIIVKSDDMYNSLGIKSALVIPNGVDFSIFKPINKECALKETGWDKTKKHILFAANPDRYEKNFKLAESAFKLLNKKNIELHYLKDVAHNKIPYYYNSSDVVLLTSLWEGSPNVIKEAMACNIPIVSTDVGDVSAVMKDTNMCFVTSFDKNEISKKVNEAIDYSEETTGRYDIQYLESSKIAIKIIELYKLVLKK